MSQQNQKLLKALVSVVATLGKVAATVTGSHRDVRQRVSPKFLPAALRRFTQSLRETLDHGDVTSMGHRGVPCLGQALAALLATPGTNWADVRAAARAWQELVAALRERWDRLQEEADELRKTCWDATPLWAKHLWLKATFRERGQPGDNLEATPWWLPVTLDRVEGASAGATHNAQVAAATSEEEKATSKAMDEAVVATSRARAAAWRGHWAVVALAPLKRLVDACEKAIEFTWDMQTQLEEIEDTLKWPEQMSPNILEALVADVAEFERLWEGSARLASHHLLPTLWDIHNLLLSPYAGPGGPGGLGGPGSRAVAKQCQKAIKDIPRLLQRQ
ncbi:uncharacterized protein LOC141725848 [Zonotrichia albicollis]|uniref:uncharacterized protein LOC141725848 n=1 Tax=Zonotrichia albicollis TaxID=44394 RepID=UPI003D8114C3